jgi:hypothetical protein
VSWSRSFAEPIALADDRVLRTLRDAGEYIAALRKADHDKPRWQTAVHELMIAAERGGLVMMAEIAMRRALPHGGQS